MCKTSLQTLVDLVELRQFENVCKMDIRMGVYLKATKFSELIGSPQICVCTSLLSG